MTQEQIITEGDSSLSLFDLANNAYSNKERIRRFECISISDVEMDEIIDEGHAVALGEDILFKTGQTMPMLVACRLDNTKPKGYSFLTLDGYSRFNGIRMVCERDNIPLPDVRVIVLYGLNKSEILEERIKAMTSIRSIKFARVVSWVQELWQETPWANLLKVSQAFTLTQNDSSGKQLLRSNLKYVPEIKVWVRRLSHLYGGDPAALAQHLIKVEEASPNVLKMARAKAGASPRNDGSFLSIESLGMIVKKFPYEYDIQEILVSYVINKHLSKDDVGLLCRMLRAEGHKNPVVLTNILSQEGWKIRKYSGENAFISSAELRADLDKLVERLWLTDLERPTKDMIFLLVACARAYLAEDFSTFPDKIQKLVLEWFVNENNARRIADDQTISQEILKPILLKRLPSEIHSLLQILVSYVFDENQYKRDAGISLILMLNPGDLGERELGQKAAANIISITTGFLSRIVVEKWDVRRTSDTLDSFCEVLPVLSSLIAKDRPEWKIFLSTLMIASELSDDLCKKAVKETIKRQKL